MGWFYAYRRSKPKTGGVKAQTRKGKFGKTWLGAQWVAIIEGFNESERLTRGRSYARHGSVNSVTIKSGIIKARVNGSYGTYTVKIETPPISAQVWDAIVVSLSQSMAITTQLISNQVPEEVKEIFICNDVKLVPELSLHTSCSCPDHVNPCKHIAAVFYLIAEEIDRDPFQLFSFRGLNRDDFMKALQKRTKTGDSKEITKKKAQSKKIVSKKKIAVQQEFNLDNFWSGQPIAINMPDNRVPDISAVLIKQLGSVPLWKGSNPFIQEMEGVYDKASSFALELITKGLVHPEMILMQEEKLH